MLKSARNRARPSGVTSTERFWSRLASQWLVLQLALRHDAPQVGVEHKTRELTVFFTGAGALLLLAGAALSMRWFARLP